MILEIAVDSGQMVNYLWLMLFLKGIVHMILGLSGSDRVKMGDKYGLTEVISGLFFLVAAWWVLA